MKLKNAFTSANLNQTKQTALKAREHYIPGKINPNYSSIIFNSTLIRENNLNPEIPTQQIPSNIANINNKNNNQTNNSNRGAVNYSNLLPTRSKTKQAQKSPTLANEKFSTNNANTSTNQNPQNNNRLNNSINFKRGNSINQPMMQQQAERAPRNFLNSSVKNKILEEVQKNMQIMNGKRVSDENFAMVVKYTGSKAVKNLQVKAVTQFNQSLYSHDDVIEPQSSFTALFDSKILDSASGEKPKLKLVVSNAEYTEYFRP